MRILPGKCDIKVRRTRILEDSYAAIMGHSGEDLKRRLMVNFDGEEGLDYGGVSRCVSVLSSRCRTSCFNPENGSSYYRTRSSIPAMDYSNILPTTIILCKSTLRAISIPIT